LWLDRPAVWFAQAEAQFELSNITRQRKKFNYVVSQLNQQQAAEVEDIISPPEQGPYDRLKAELVRRLSTSREQRETAPVARGIGGPQAVTDDFLRTIWASRLPPHVQAILASQTEGSLDSASHLADRICEVTPLPITASISRSTPNSSAGLLERIEELTRQVASLQASQHGSRLQPRGRHRSQSRDCHRDTSNYPPTPHDTCWYHFKFGDEARKCTPPCSRQQRDSRQDRDSRQQENFISGR
jgi:hypothetical protein